MYRVFRNIRVFLLVLTLSLAAGAGAAQENLSDVDFDKIKQRKIRKLIKQQQTEKISSFSEMHVTVNEETELQDYSRYEKNYILKLNPDEVWYNYVNSSQTEIWDISKISFGLLYCRETDSVFYADQILLGLQERRIYFINLKILNGLYNLPVAFEITRIDPDKKTIEFSYLRGGKAKGKQIIKISESENGFTLINHQTYVKSSSSLRDKYLYPYFHNKLINEFHLNMKRTIASRVRSRENLLAEHK